MSTEVGVSGANLIISSNNSISRSGGHDTTKKLMNHCLVLTSLILSPWAFLIDHDCVK